MTFWREKEKKGRKETRKGVKGKLVCVSMFAERIDVQNSPHIKSVWQWLGEA